MFTKSFILLVFVQCFAKINTNTIESKCLTYWNLYNIIPDAYFSFWQKPYRNLSGDLDPNRIRFYLLTRSNRFFPDEIEYNDFQSLRNSHFRFDRPTIFYVHSWLSFPIMPILPNIHKEILDSRDVNLFIIDWSANAFTFEDKLLSNTPVVCQRFSDFLNWLINSGALNVANLHLIGFSMGAHIAGVAARGVTSGKVAKVTGLDPPEISDDVYELKLRKGDADYVEIFHTTIDTISQKKPSGDADYYPNWGQKMPGCLTLLCNHIKSLEYYADSLKREFVTYKCINYEEIISRSCSRQDQNKIGRLSSNNLYGVYYFQA